MSPPKYALSPTERLFFRDRLRAARYGALANAEGFGSVCFVLEALGLRLLGKQAALGEYRESIRELVTESTSFSYISAKFPSLFCAFESLYRAVTSGRNDAMHTGVYARNVTHKAVELCIGLEEATMSSINESATVADFMVKSPFVVEGWQPLAHARQLMLLHSISYLPYKQDDEWKLLSETALLKYIGVGSYGKERNEKLGKLIENAPGLQFMAASVVPATTPVRDLLRDLHADLKTKLWLVVDNDLRKNLVGVFTSFDLL